MSRLEWEREHESARVAPALTGAFLGGALGADCFLAVERFLWAPAVLCGVVMAFCAVKGGWLLSGRRSRRGALLALPVLVLWVCLAHHACFALKAAPGDPAAVWAAFAGLEALSTSGAARYWLRLSGLLGTAAAAWVMLYLRAKREEALTAAAVRPCRAVPEPPPADMEFFLPCEPWIEPVRLLTQIRRCVCLGLLCLGGWMGTLVGHEQIWTRAAIGMAVSILYIASCAKRSRRICRASSILYVRTEGQLWYVALDRIQDPELRVRLSKLVRIWDRMPASRQKLFRSAVAEAVAEEDGAAVKIESASLERESSWEWVLSSLTGQGAIVPKVYPDLAPVPGAERAKGPIPLPWSEAVGTLVLAVLCVGIGCGMGLQAELREMDAPTPPPAESVLPDETPFVLPDPVAPDPATRARVPEEIGYYYLNGMELQTDSAFEVTTNHITDQEDGVRYEISLQYGVGEEAIQAVLGAEEGDQVRYLRSDSADPLWRMGENTVVYRYDIRTKHLPDGQTAHTGAALSERGTMFLIECVHGGDVEEEAVRGTMLFLLENLKFTGPAITGENYQDQLRPAVNLGLNYCGQALIRAPQGLFGYDAFLDTFLPCGGTLHYYDDGLSVMTSVHGLRVSAAIVPGEGTALEVLEGIYQDLKAAGRQYDEQSLMEDSVSPNGDSAGRAAVYYDGGRTRATVLYVVKKWDGYYLFKEMTCLPEEIDGEYEAVVKEMEAACNMSAPYLEEMGRFIR